MYKIKDAARRVSALAGAIALMLGIGASVLPAMASADALNPLTERSLTLTSSSPGYHYLDGANNPTYAPAGSGNNGQKTGEVLTFKVSTAATVYGFSMQWCTTPAGQCLAPGDNYAKHTNHTDSVDSTDFNINFPTPSQGTVAHGPNQHLSADNFQIFIGGTQETGGVASNPNPGSGATDWDMTVSNLEDYTPTPAMKTGMNNYVVFTNATGVALTAGQEVSIVLYGTDDNYITNPGSGAFYVKANTYDSNAADYQNFRDNYPLTGNHCDTDHTTYLASSPTDTCNQNVVDGGVTVANVMNDSIQIQTKVLETMAFSVGTTNPEADSTVGAGNHGTCHTIDHNDPISLGDPAAEYSLKTDTAYDGYSYWRLSSNSSNGATVYYSGYSLTNTENDSIDAIYDANTGTNPGGTPGDNTASKSVRGTEQFGLAVEEPTASDTDGAISRTERAADTLQSGQGALSLGTLDTLVATTGYGSGEGLINNAANTALFAFDLDSLYVPRAVAAETTDVIHCSTARMRYVANIAPDTPAGIYTTKINYIAAPEY